MPDRTHEMADIVRDLVSYQVKPAAPFRLIIEYPRIEKFGRGKQIPPDDILGVVLTIGCIRGSLPRPTREDLVRPSQWKGTADGDAMVLHIYSRLTESEKKIVEPHRLKSKRFDDNVLDACGIGLWALGRL